MKQFCSQISTPIAGLKPEHRTASMLWLLPQASEQRFYDNMLGHAKGGLVT